MLAIQAESLSWPSMYYPFPLHSPTFLSSRSLGPFSRSNCQILPLSSPHLDQLHSTTSLIMADDHGSDDSHVGIFCRISIGYRLTFVAAVVFIFSAQLHQIGRAHV